MTTALKATVQFMRACGFPFLFVCSLFVWNNYLDKEGYIMSPRCIGRFSLCPQTFSLQQLADPSSFNTKGFNRSPLQCSIIACAINQEYRWLDTKLIAEILKLSVSVSVRVFPFLSAWHKVDLIVSRLKHFGNCRLSAYAARQWHCAAKLVEHGTDTRKVNAERV